MSKWIPINAVEHIAWVMEQNHFDFQIESISKTIYDLILRSEGKCFSKLESSASDLHVTKEIRI